MSNEYLRIGVALAFVALMLVAAIIDILKRKIHNVTVLVLLGVFVAALGTGMITLPWWSVLGAFAIAFAVTFGLFAMGIFGGGDAKLFSVAALFTGLSGLGPFAVLTALAGGVLAVIYLVANPKRALRGLTAKGRAEGGSRGVPYGVAIAIGAVATLYFRGFFNVA